MARKKHKSKSHHGNLPHDLQFDLSDAGKVPEDEKKDFKNKKLQRLAEEKRVQDIEDAEVLDPSDPKYEEKMKRR